MNVQDAITQVFGELMGLTPEELHAKLDEHAGEHPEGEFAKTLHEMSLFVGRYVSKLVGNKNYLVSRNKREGWYFGKRRLPLDLSAWIFGRKEHQTRSSRKDSLRESRKKK